jgi:hypothetical protein
MSALDDSRPFGVPEGSALLMKTWSDGEAEVVRRLLEAYEIPCQVISDITHSVCPVNVDGLGEVRIFVPASSLEEAEDILREHRRQGAEPPSGDGEEGEDTAPPESGGEQE